MTIQQSAERFFYEQNRVILTEAPDDVFEKSDNEKRDAIGDLIATRAETNAEMIRKLEVAASLRNQGHDILVDGLIESVIFDLSAQEKRIPASA